MITAIKTPSLDDRIAAAFLDDATSAAVAELIGEVEAAAASSGEAADAARARALDPALSAAEVARARRAMEDAAFRRDRMQEAVRRLGERHRELRRQEEQARRQIAYDAALAERDEVAAALRQEYPALAARLAELVARVEASDREVERVNDRALPAGARRLEPAELVARGLRGFVVDGVSNVPRIRTDLRLPAFEYSGHDPYTWPRLR